MTEHKWTLPSSDFPKQDHEAFLVLSDGRFDQVTIYGYARTWSMFLMAVNMVLHGFLQVDLARRVTIHTVEIFARSLAKHLRPSDVVATLRAFKTCTRHVFGVEADCLSPIIKRIQAEAEETGNLARSKKSPKAIAADELRGNTTIQIERLQSAKRDNGRPLSASTIRQYDHTVRLFVGLLDRKNICWRSLSPINLLSAKNISLIAHEWSSDDEPWKAAQRLNILACAFQHLYDTASVTNILSAAANLRSLNPEGNAAKNHHTYVPIDRVMDEDRKRLDFSLKRNFNQPFVYNGKSYHLKYRPSRDATAQKCKDTLRALTTVLEISAPDILQQPTEERDYKKVIMLFAAYYSDCPVSAQLAALDRLRSLLVRILPVSTDLRSLRRKIRDLKRKITVEDLVVHDVHPDEIIQFAIGVMNKSYRRFIDLRDCKVPYSNPMEYALRYRSALQIGVLAHNPLRLRSLRLLDVGEFDRKEFGQEIRYFVRVPKEKMKMGVKHDFLLPSALTPWVDRYLNEIREAFFLKPDKGDKDQRTIGEKTRDEKAMWISKNESRMSTTALSLSIPAMMIELCGFRINIQLFRRFVATAEVGTEEGSRRLAQRNRMSRKAYEDARKAQNVDRTTSLRPLFNELSTKYGYGGRS